MRHYEVVVILEPGSEERTVGQPLDNYLKVIRDSGGVVEKLDVWGRRRLAYEIAASEGIYAVMDLRCTPGGSGRLDRRHDRRTCCKQKAFLQSGNPITADSAAVTLINTSQ